MSLPWIYLMSSMDVFKFVHVFPVAYAILCCICCWYIAICGALCIVSSLCPPIVYVWCLFYQCILCCDYWSSLPAHQTSSAVHPRVLFLTLSGSLRSPSVHWYGSRGVCVWPRMHVFFLSWWSAVLRVLRLFLVLGLVVV